MTAAAPTSGLTNPPTGAVRLLAALRWLVLLLLVYWLVAGGRRLAAALRQGTAHPDFPLFAKRFGTDDPAVILARVTRGLRHAEALEAALFATGPTGRRLADIAHRRAIAARIIDIGRDLGVFRAAPTRASNLAQRWLASLAFAMPSIAAETPPGFAHPASTGPPQSTPRPRSGRGCSGQQHRSCQNARARWNFSGRTRVHFPVHPFLRARAARLNRISAPPRLCVES